MTKGITAANFAQTLFPGAPEKGWEVSPQTQAYLRGCLSLTTSVICK